jgi:hypothetical protein
MAVPKWRGSSLNIRQQTTITIANTWTAADTVTITIDNVSFVITIGTLITTAQVATTIYQALQGVAFTDTTASATILTADGGGVTIPQFSEMTAAAPTASVVTLTSNGTGPLAGKPVTITVTESTASTGTATGAVAITATSQYHANQTDNWSTNAVPIDSDTVVFDDGNIDCRYLLTLGVQPTTITKTKKYTGNVGLPEYNNDNSSKVYREYRTPTYLTTTGAAAVTANLETGEGPGSGRFKLDTGNGNATVNIFGRGSRAEAGIPCILWKGSGTNIVNNIAGDCGIAYFTEETATVGTLVTGDGPQSSAYTFCGAGCTLTTVTLNGGTQETASAITTATQNAGVWKHRLGTITTLNVNGGTFYPTGAATITTLNLYGTLDCTQGSSSFTVTNTINLYKGSRIIDPQGRLGNAVFKLNGATFADVTIVGPLNKTFTPS